MRKLTDLLFRITLAALVLVILGTLFLGAALALLDIPGATYRLGTPAPSLNQVERLLLSTYLALFEDALQGPIGDPGSTYTLFVQEGETARAVITNLSDSGLLKRPFLFQMYLRYLGFDRGIEPGEYPLNGTMTMVEVALDLQNARPGEIQFTLIPGLRLEEAAQALASSFADIDASLLMDAFAMPAIGTSFEAEIPSGAGLEGYLFPGTYIFLPDASPTDIAFTMLDEFDAMVTQDLRRGFAEQGLTLHEAVILASIVEREAVLIEEMPQISSVYLNRLAIGMLLEADPTVQYAMGFEGNWWKSPLSFNDLDIESPYNTYRYPGLPPGPIASPGIDALNAVANPASTSFLFFRAACDGSGAHRFATTFEEHLQNACP